MRLRARLRAPANRRVVLRRQAFFVRADEIAGVIGRALLLAGKVVGLVAAVAGTVVGVDQGVRHVVASPRFAVRELRVSPTTHATREELLAAAGVREGDRLLSIDTDAVAVRLAAHPWVASARVRRELPGALVLDVTERRAAAVVVMGTLYLVDETGHPFKRASVDEADGLPLVTGIDRERYAEVRIASEAAIREALALAAEYRGKGTHPRPPLSEVHVNPATGYGLVLADGGAEIRLGRPPFAAKLARLDAIIASLGRDDATALRVVHLDGAGDRIPVRLAQAEPQPEPEPEPVRRGGHRAARAHESPPSPPRDRESRP